MEDEGLVAPPLPGKRPREPTDNVWCRYCRKELQYSSSYTHLKSQEHSLARSQYRIAAPDAASIRDLPRAPDRYEDAIDLGMTPIHVKDDVNS
jgi:hypothetical protein